MGDGPLRRSFRFAALEDGIYLFSGNDCEKLLNDLWKYNVTSGNWSESFRLRQRAVARIYPAFAAHAPTRSLLCLAAKR